MDDDYETFIAEVEAFVDVMDDFQTLCKWHSRLCGYVANTSNFTLASADWDRIHEARIRVFDRLEKDPYFETCKCVDGYIKAKNAFYAGKRMENT